MTRFYNEDDDTTYDMLLIEVLLPAGDIPDGATVTKRTGAKEYKLKHKIKIYADKDSGTSAQVLEADGVKYLTGDGAINAISDKVVLIWKTTTGELHQFLEDMLNPEEDK